MSRLRVLVLAPGCNPDTISTRPVEYLTGEALARLHAVTLVVTRHTEEPLRSRTALFDSIEYINVSWLERCLDWSVRWIFKGDHGSHVLTAMMYPLCLVIECSAWRRLKGRI